MCDRCRTGVSPTTYACPICHRHDTPGEDHTWYTDLCGTPMQFLMVPAMPYTVGWSHTHTMGGWGNTCCTYTTDWTILKVAKAY